MERPKERNEFGPDRYNEMDVRDERGDNAITWALGALAIFAVFALLAFFTSNTDTQTAFNKPAATTTGAGGANMNSPPPSIPSTKDSAKPASSATQR
jgi:hypothetical protein